MVLHRLRTHKAIDTDDLINILTEVEKLTRVAITHPESNDADVRKQLGRRAEYLISLIKVTKAEDKEHWMNELDDLLDSEYNKYSPFFDSEDLKERLLSMRRFLGISIQVLKLADHEAASDPRIERYRNLYYQVKSKCVLKK